MRFFNSVTDSSLVIGVFGTDGRFSLFAIADPTSAKNLFQSAEPMLDFNACPVNVDTVSTAVAQACWSRVRSWTSILRSLYTVNFFAFVRYLNTRCTLR